MITGIVTEFEARVRVSIRDAAKRFQEIEAIVDTGFTAWLALPPSLVASLGLRWKSDGRGGLADGSASRFDIHFGTILWHDRTQRIPVYALGATPLIGMALLYGCEFTMKVRPRGPVTIKPLRRRRGS